MIPWAALTGHDPFAYMLPSCCWCRCQRILLAPSRGVRAAVLHWQGVTHLCGPSHPALRRTQETSLARVDGIRRVQAAQLLHAASWHQEGTTTAAAAMPPAGCGTLHDAPALRRHGGSGVLAGGPAWHIDALAGTAAAVAPWEPSVAAPEVAAASVEGSVWCTDAPAAAAAASAPQQPTGAAAGGAAASAAGAAGAPKAAATAVEDPDAKVAAAGPPAGRDAEAAAAGSDGGAALAETNDGNGVPSSFRLLASTLGRCNTGV